MQPKHPPESNQFQSLASYHIRPVKISNILIHNHFQECGPRLYPDQEVIPGEITNFASVNILMFYGETVSLITGYGIISAIGLNAEEVLESLLNVVQVLVKSRVSNNS